jgi:hypothetical protein
MSPRWGSTPRFTYWLTGWPTISRNVTLTLIWPSHLRVELCNGGWEEMALKLSWQFSCLVLNSEQRRDHRSCRISTADNCYQATTSADTAGWRKLSCRNQQQCYGYGQQIYSPVHTLSIVTPKSWQYKNPFTKITLYIYIYILWL